MKPKKQQGRYGKDNNIFTISYEISFVVLTYVGSLLARELIGCVTKSMFTTHRIYITSLANDKSSFARYARYKALHKIHQPPDRAVE